MPRQPVAVLPQRARRHAREAPPPPPPDARPRMPPNRAPFRCCANPCPERRGYFAGEIERRCRQAAAAGAAGTGGERPARQQQRKAQRRQRQWHMAAIWQAQTAVQAGTRYALPPARRGAVISSPRQIRKADKNRRDTRTEEMSSSSSRHQRRDILRVKIHARECLPQQALAAARLQVCRRRDTIQILLRRRMSQACRFHYRWLLRDTIPPMMLDTPTGCRIVDDERDTRYEQKIEI